jgi:hypothetical protein
MHRYRLARVLYEDNCPFEGGTAANRSALIAVARLVRARAGPAARLRFGAALSAALRQGRVSSWQFRKALLQCLVVLMA